MGPTSPLQSHFRIALANGGVGARDQTKTLHVSGESRTAHKGPPRPSTKPPFKRQLRENSKTRIGDNGDTQSAKWRDVLLASQHRPAISLTGNGAPCKKAPHKHHDQQIKSTEFNSKVPLFEVGLTFECCGFVFGSVPES